MSDRKTPARKATEAPYELANLHPARTGLPFVVWIAENMYARRRDLRIKVGRSRKIKPAEMVSVAIRRNVRVVGAGDLSERHMTLLRQWVALNRDVIIRYWDREMDSGDALAALKPIQLT